MKMRKPTITIQLHGCVFNRKIVRRIAFQYWIAFMVALEEGCIAIKIIVDEVQPLASFGMRFFIAGLLLVRSLYLDSYHLSSIRKKRPSNSSVQK